MNPASQPNQPDPFSKVTQVASRVFSSLGRVISHQETFPVQASVLSGDALASRVLSQYGFTGPIVCRFQSKELNDMYTVSVPNMGQTHYLRVYRHGFWNKDQIAAEVAIMNGLAESGIPVSKAISYKQGHIIHELTCPEGVRYAVLFEGVQGYHATNWHAEQCRMFGRGLAEMHQALDTCKGELARPSYTSARAGWQSIEKARPFFGVRSEDFDFLETTTQALASYIDRRPEYPHGYGLIHADLHPVNVLFDSRKVKFIDFDLCGYGPRAYELASFVWGRLKVANDSIEDMSRRFDAVIDGYREVLPFPDEEKDRVAACLVFRELYRIGLDCDGPAVWGFRWLTSESWGDSLNFIKKWLDANPHLLEERV